MVPIVFMLNAYVLQEEEGGWLVRVGDREQHVAQDDVIDGIPAGETFVVHESLVVGTTYAAIYLRKR